MGNLVADILNNLTYHYSERLMKDGLINLYRGKNIMVKFKLVSSSEDRVITVNAAKSITLNGQVIAIGSHLVTFSGRAKLSPDDQTTVKNMADQNGDARHNI